MLTYCKNNLAKNDISRELEHLDLEGSIHRIKCEINFIRSREMFVRKNDIAFLIERHYELTDLIEKLFEKYSIQQESSCI
ncbi:MAG: hypothetical protein CMF50_03405 [Legionellales bacterium]|nr:hypothetical protein [Legionellales bacterium]|tara:strand:+ start:19888 stop:20127 length:240 start_codon:yes stop_codon:yes gene_type:complete